MSLIEIKNLRKEYPNAVPLENVSVNIDAGEVVSIIGPSGTGKSTFLRCINRLETPTSGEIWIDGVNVCDPNTDLPSIRKQMGMVFQSFNLFPHKMVAENIMMPQQQILGVSAADAYREAIAQLAKVGLEAKARNYPDELSGGQKQRVAIARALAMHPKIILFDEPTSALDPNMVSEVLSIITNLAKTDLTMLIVTHEMRLAKSVSSRILFMDQGGVYEDGTPEQIFDHPQRERTRNFIYRVRTWEYAISASIDIYEMMANLESFCRLQFMGKKASNDCQLSVEELVMGYLLPVLRKSPDKVAVIRIEAGEEEKGFSLVVDTRDLPGADFMAGEQNELANILLQNLLKRMPDQEPGVAVFARQ